MSVYEVPTPIGSPINEHPIDIDEDETLINPSQPLTLPTTQTSTAITMSYQPSASLRNGTDPQSNHPTWTHTKNVQVNHELDSLRAIYDTIADSTSGFTATQRTDLIVEHIKRRAATIRIGATFGWSKVPESELQRDFVRLGLTNEGAQLAVTQQHSFRGNSSHSSSRGGRKAPKRGKSKKN